MNNKELNVSRRDFLKGAGVTAAGAAALGLAGCASQAAPVSASASAEASAAEEAEASSASAASAAPAEASASTAEPAAAPVAGYALGDPDNENTAPFPPADVPDAWDDEADVVIVGMGGGGLAASLYCAEAGLKVISLEKEGSIGGATQHACGWFTLPGAGRDQIAAKYAFPEFPLDRKKFIRGIQPFYDYSFDEDLLWQVAVKGGETIDWIQNHDIPMMNMGPVYLDSRVTGGIQPLGMRYVCQDVEKLATEAGADIRLNNECLALVMEDGRVTGVQAHTSDGDKFIRAEKGVILCTGAFGANKDMLAKYAPSALRTAAVGGPFPFADGRGQRMAIGAGADVCGIDSWCAWEAYPYRGDGAYWTYHWDGSVILCCQPWLTIDKMGKRYGYYTTDTEEHPDYIGGDGDFVNAAVQMSRMGGGGYCIFDADYEKHMEILSPETPFTADRHPLTEARLDAAGIKDKDVVASLCALDWRDDVAKALERGDIKQADTIEGLAEALELDPAILQAAVDDWNATCAKGNDDDTIWPYKPEWLIPIEKGPFFGAKISGGIGKTFAGPRVTPKMEVVDTDAHVIPGLYAHFMTAGGICSENMWNGTMFNTTIQGGNAVSWISGYMAAQAVVEA